MRLICLIKFKFGLILFFLFPSIFKNRSLSCVALQLFNQQSSIIKIYIAYICSSAASPLSILSYKGRRIESCTFGRGAFAKDKSVTIIDIVLLCSPWISQNRLETLSLFLLSYLFLIFYFIIPNTVWEIRIFLQSVSFNFWRKLILFRFHLIFKSVSAIIRTQNRNLLRKIREKKHTDTYIYIYTHFSNKFLN